ncbi:MAG: transposase [Deinococcus sp.]|nr:transposase [Deinococcus sp.]
MAFKWLPHARTDWQTFTDARKEAARLWNDMVVRHQRIRRLNWRWPSRRRWERWAKCRYPRLHSQSVQQIIGEFDEAIRSARQLRQKGDLAARYPWKLHRYRDVIYTNQAARIVGGDVILPNGGRKALRVHLPPNLILPGRLIEARVSYGRVLLVCEVPDEAHPAQTSIGVDLGVNTLIAATDGDQALLISGREAKATVQWCNKRLASLSAKQSHRVKGSRRWKRLQRRKHRMVCKARNRVRDITHKATAIVREAFPAAAVYVGEPFNDAARKVGRKQAQQVSSACNSQLIGQLDYKCSGATTVPEPYSSQTCPVCGCRQRCRRTYTCQQCGYSAPRDVVGALNILRRGKHGALVQSTHVPTRITYLRPRCRSSSGGHPARSSRQREAARF